MPLQLSSGPHTIKIALLSYSIQIILRHSVIVHSILRVHVITQTLAGKRLQPFYLQENCENNILAFQTVLFRPQLAANHKLYLYLFCNLNAQIGIFMIILAKFMNK